MKETIQVIPMKEVIPTKEKIQVILRDYHSKKERFSIDLSEVKRILYIVDVEEAIKVEYNDGSYEFLSAGWDYDMDEYYEIYNKEDTLYSNDLRALLNEDRKYGDLIWEGVYFDELFTKQRRNRRKDNHTSKASHKRFI